MVVKNKLLVVVGPTAVGKTKLALQLAEEFNGELVSADSRQVYKRMDIGTGKDKPKDTKIWGYDLVEPTEEFSVADYIKIARKIVTDIRRHGKLPILVGGTGFYIQGLIDGISTINVPKNEKLRIDLADKSVSELLVILKDLNPRKVQSLNQSDKNNSRRLIRAIEIASSKQKNQKVKGLRNRDVLFVGLRMDKKKLGDKIEKRVEQRLKRGFEKEMEKLIKEGISWDNQAMQALGYRQWRECIEGKKTKAEVIIEWKKGEKRYAKRQMVWFKRDERINWFDANKVNYQKEVEKLVKKWYFREKNVASN